MMNLEVVWLVENNIIIIIMNNNKNNTYNKLYDLLYQIKIIFQNNENK